MVVNPISNAQIKHIRLLQQKKFRQRYHQFIVEGAKSVLEFVQSSLSCFGIYASSEWIERDGTLVQHLPVHLVNTKQMGQISNLKNPSPVLGVFEMPMDQRLDTAQDLVLGLEAIRDPGNLGTIIRTADWFGLKQVVCSEECADCYNPKVIQASMGSLSRVEVMYKSLAEVNDELEEHQLTLADMTGTSWKEFEWSKNFLIIGNEAKGISASLESLKHEKITIAKKGEAESLNAAISTAILLSSR